MNWKPKTEAEEHGLEPGDRVIVITISGKHGDRRLLFRYDTGADFEEESLISDGFTYRRGYGQWDGVERVSFYNGD